jgi:hypothetical protein
VAFADDVGTRSIGGSLQHGNAVDRKNDIVVLAKIDPYSVQLLFGETLAVRPGMYRNAISIGVGCRFGEDLIRSWSAMCSPSAALTTRGHQSLRKPVSQENPRPRMISSIRLLALISPGMRSGTSEPTIVRQSDKAGTGGRG